MKKRKALVLAMVLSITACGNTNAVESSQGTSSQSTESQGKTKEYLIGVTTFMDAEQAAAEFKVGMEAAAKDLSKDGLVVTLTSFDSAGDASKQVSGLENFISKQVDAMCFSAIDADAVVPIVNEARAAGIKVVSFDQKINTETDAQVTIDNPAVGSLMAETLAKLLNYKGKVFVITTPPEVIACIERSDAAIKVFEGYGMTVVQAMSDSPTRDKHMTLVENALQANPDIVGMIGIDTDTTLGEVLACKAQGKNDIIVVGPDITPESREVLVKNEQLKAMIDTLHYDLGYQAIVATVKSLNGEKVEPVILKEFKVETPDSTK